MLWYYYGKVAYDSNTKNGMSLKKASAVFVHYNDQDSPRTHGDCTHHHQSSNTDSEPYNIVNFIPPRDRKINIDIGIFIGLWFFKKLRQVQNYFMKVIKYITIILPSTIYDYLNLYDHQGTEMKVGLIWRITKRLWREKV